MGDSTAIQASITSASLPPDRLRGELRPDVLAETQAVAGVRDVATELLRAIDALENTGLRRLARPVMEEIIDAGTYQLDDVMRGGQRALKLSCALGDFLIDPDTMRVTAPLLLRVL